jgi:hypothetical protein
MAKTSTPEEMAATMIANLKTKTGRSLDEWLKLAAPHRDARHGEIVTWLKTEHGVTHGFANLIAHELRDGGASVSNPIPGGELIDAQYGGKKAGLRPIYEMLAAAIQKFGDDVELAPKKTYVSLRRSKQFGLIQPTTATRLDVGINLKGIATTARLEASGSFNAMVSHRVRVESPADVDDELIGWLRAAYDAA